MSTVLDRYPRTLSAWLKCDDKMLLNAVANGQSVLEVAEDLQREHVLVLVRLNDLRLFEYTAATEAWAEFMGLAMAGVPLQVVIDWCTGSPDRLDAADIDDMAMGDLRPEFYLAYETGMVVANSDAVADLSWLVNQPDSVKAGIAQACQRVSDCFDVLTPQTLRSQMLALTPAPLAWLGSFPGNESQRGSWGGSKRYSKGSRRAPALADGYAAPVKKRYRKKSSSTAAAGATKVVKAGTGRTYKAYKKSSKSRYVSR